jgi:4-amino-4-deoxy-L-arabinose transferase-like glycosyltransferase
VRRIERYLSRIASLQGWQMAALLYVTAAAIRIAYVVHAGAVISPDSHEYMADASAIAHGQIATLHRPPLYPLFLAAMGNDPHLAVLAQALVTAFCAPLLGDAARRQFGHAAGWLSGFLAAAEPALVFWTSYVLSDALTLAVLALFVELASVVLERPSVLVEVMFGASGGILAIARAAYIPLAVLGAGAAALSRDRPRRAVLTFVSGLFLVIVVAWSPTLLVGSTPHYASSYWETLYNGTQWNEVGRGTSGVDINHPSSVDTLTEAEQVAFYRTEVVRFVTSNPGGYLVLALRKALWYWLPAYPEWSLSHRIWSSAYFTAMYLLAIVGAAVAIRSHFAWLLLAIAAFSTLTAMVTLVDYDARYRLPAELAIIPLASVGLLELLARVRALRATAAT